MGKETEIEQRSFAGGLHTLLPASKLNQNETPSCYDVTFDRGRLEKRTGYSRILNLALTDPALQFSGAYGHVRIPAHADFVYGTDFEVVVKFRVDSLPTTGQRQTLYCHGYAGGTNSASADLLRGLWIHLEYNTVSSTVVAGMTITYSDGSNTVQRLRSTKAIVANTNYSVHCRRFDDSGTDRLQVIVEDLDATTTTTTPGVASVADANLDVSAFPINVGGAPALDTAIVLNPRQTIGVDASGGLRHVAGGGADPSSIGAVQELFAGTIGELQIWIGNDGSRNSTTDTTRIDSLDADIALLKGYWLFNEGTGTTVGCSRNHTINAASSKDGIIIGERPQYVEGLVGEGSTGSGAKHALKFNGFDQYLHTTDLLYTDDIAGGGQTFAYDGILEKFMFGNQPSGLSANPWTFEFAFQFHKDPTDYNIAGGRKQCLCSVYYYFTDNGTTPNANQIPMLLFYIDTDNHLKIDIVEQLVTGASPLAVTYVTLDGGAALTKDTTYHVALMHYNSFKSWAMYVNGTVVANHNAATNDNPDIDGVVDANFEHKVHIFFAMNNDKFVEWNDQSPGSGEGGYRNDDKTSAAAEGAAMPSNCTIDEVRFWGWEDVSGNPVGTRDPAAGGGGVTAVPAPENPPTENLIAKYFDAELGAFPDYGKNFRTNEEVDRAKLATGGGEISGRIGLWLYYDFRENWQDHLYYTDVHQAVLDQGWYRYLPAIMIPASNPPKWNQGILSVTTNDTNYASNALVHNPVAPINALANFARNNETQQLVFAQSSALRSYSSGSSYTDIAGGMQKNQLGSISQGRDLLFLVNSPRVPVKFDGTSLSTIGIETPTQPITTGYISTLIRNARESALLSDRFYTYRYTYYNKTLNIESHPSPESAAFFTDPPNLGLSAGGRELLLRCGTINDPQVTHLRIYRSEPFDNKATDLIGHSSDRGSFWALVAELKVAGTIGNQGTTSFTPLVTEWEGKSETDLGPILPVELGLFVSGGTPPTGVKFSEFWRDRLFVARTSEHPARLWFSEVGIPETFVADAFLDFDDGDGQPITALVALFNYLIVFKSDSLYVVSEDSGGPNQFIRAPFSKFKLHTNVGCASHFAAKKLDQNAVIFLSNKGVYLTDGRSVEYLSRKIENIFRDDISKSQMANAQAAVYRKRNLVFFAVSVSSTSNDTLLVYDYVQQNWSRYKIAVRSLVSTRDANGVERIFFGGVQLEGYLFRLDSGNTDGVEIVFPASATEPDNLTGAPSVTGTTTTLVGPVGNNWNTVTGDKLRGARIEIIKAGVTTTHTIIATDATTAGRVTFTPPLAAVTADTDTYRIAGIRAQWDTMEFVFGGLRDKAALQDLDVFQAVQASGAGTVYLKVDKGSYQLNENTFDLTNYRSKVPFKGIGWTAANDGTSRGFLLQLRFEQLDPNIPFDIHDLVYTIEPFEGET